MTKKRKSFLKRLSGILLILTVLCIGGLYLWARHKYPNYSKDFYVPNRWLEAEEKVVAKIELSDWQNHQLQPKLQHRKLILNQSEAWPIPTELLEDLPPSKPLMLTLECWGSKYWPIYRSQPLSSLKSGAYDAKLKDLAQKLSEAKFEVYLRFNPQMEVPGRFYPWQEYPSIYIDAYRHVYRLIKSIAPQVQMVWAPAGYPGLEEYYPGRDYVDALSINLIGDSEELLSVYPKEELPQELYRRLHRLRFFNHPCFVLSSEHFANEELDAEALNKLGVFHRNNPATYNEQYFQQNDFAREGDSIFKFGVYDPDEKLLHLASVNTEHLFVDLTLLLEQGLDEDLAAIAQRKHDLILTLELHKDSSKNREERGLEKLLAGTYDPCLDILAGLLDSFPNQIYLRFPQEMEIPIHRYPWQSKDPKLYIDAYRYGMSYMKKRLNRLKLVWGPAGDRGSLEWYPGSDVVDYISIAIYGLPDKNIVDPRKQESFQQIYRRKSWRMRHAPKSIFITEFGVKGPEDYQKQWLLQAAETIKSAPELSGINYFNMHDVPKAWGEIEPPNWSVEASTYHAFLKAINEGH